MGIFLTGLDNENILYGLYSNILIGSMSLTVCGMLFVSVANLIFALSVRKNKKWHYKGVATKGNIITTVILSILLTVFVELVCSHLFKTFLYNNVIFMIILAIFILKHPLLFIVKHIIIKTAPETINAYKKKSKKERGPFFASLIKALSYMVILVGMAFSMSFLNFYYIIYNVEDPYGVIDNFNVVEKMEEDRAKSLHSFYNNDSLIDLMENLADRNTQPSITNGYSYNYIFYDNFINDTKEKIKELMPDSSSESGFEEYLERIKSLEEDIEIATERRDSSYLTTACYYYESEGSYRFELLEYLDMSAGTENAGEEKEATLIRLSSTVYSTKTEFDNVNILAYVEYTDGSRRFSLITPTNIDELNSASAGTHYLKFSDEWGSYEVEITIN